MKEVKNPPRKPTKPEQNFTKRISESRDFYYGDSIKDIVDWAAKLGVTDLSKIKIGNIHSDSFSDGNLTIELNADVAVNLSDDEYAKRLVEYEKKYNEYLELKPKYDSYVRNKKLAEKEKQKALELKILQDLIKKYPEAASNKKI